MGVSDALSRAFWKQHRPPAPAPVSCSVPKQTRDELAAEIVRFGYQIGEFTYGSPAVWNFSGADYLSIGRYCSIGAQVSLILGGDHEVQRVTTSPLGLWFPKHAALEQGGPPMGIAIGNDVWIGQGATILGARRIGDGAVIGAGAVVARDVAPYEIVVGNPARPIRKRFSEPEIAALLDIQWWNWPTDQVEEFTPLLLAHDIQAFIRSAQQRQLK